MIGQFSVLKSERTNLGSKTPVLDLGDLIWSGRPELGLAGFN